MQLRLGTCFQPPVEFGAEFDDLFDHLSLLVDLDRINAEITSLIFRLFTGNGKTLVNLGHALFENIGKTQQQWRMQTALGQFIAELFEVHLMLTIRRRHHVACFVNAEKTAAPAFHLIEFSSSFCRPGIIRHGFSPSHSVACCASQPGFYATVQSLHDYRRAVHPARVCLQTLPGGYSAASPVCPLR